jgi:phosphoglycerate kinase
MDAESTQTGSRRVRSVHTANVEGRAVLVRADLNVPLRAGAVADDTRIRASLPTLELLRDRGARSITVCSHLGRPKGPDAALSLAPVEARLRDLFDGPLTVLENTRFDPGETTNDPVFAARLAAGQDLFVQDAFGSVHRAHASTVGVAELLPTYAGLLLEQELEHLDRLLDEPARPFVLVCGGAKVDDKLGVLAHLGGLADTVLVGGRLAEQLRVANPLSFPVELPVDVVAAAQPDATEVRICAPDTAPYGWLVLDIGPETQVRFAETLAGAATIFWNGPLGMFESPRFAAGTFAVATAVAASPAYSVVGGGDTVRALDEQGLADRVSWVSTGGGAALELLEGRELPGVAVIPTAIPA